MRWNLRKVEEFVSLHEKVKHRVKKEWQGWVGRGHQVGCLDMSCILFGFDDRTEEGYKSRL